MSAFAKMLAARAQISPPANITSAPSSEPEVKKDSTEDKDIDPENPDGTPENEAVMAATLLQPKEAPIVYEVDHTKPVRFAMNFTRRVMVGRWVYPKEDGFFYPESIKEEAALWNLAKQGAVTPENFERSE